MQGPAAPVESGSEYESRFIRVREVLWRNVAGSVLVRTVADSDIVELSGTAVLLWLALADALTVGELAAELAGVLDAPLEVVTDDVRSALEELVRRGLIARCDAI